MARDTTASSHAKRRRVLRRLALILALLLPLIALLAFTWRLWSTRGYRQAEGIYLADGGRSFVRIKTERFGRVRLEQGFIPEYMFPPGAEEWAKEYRLEEKAAYRNARLHLTQTEILEEAPFFFPGKPKPGERVEAALTLLLLRQPEGDWALAAARHVANQHIPFSSAFHDATGKITKGKIKDGFEALLNGTVGVWMRNPLVVYQTPDAFTPLPSFLHRIDDPRIPDYFNLRQSEQDPQAALTTIRAICADHPDHPILMLHLAELEAATGNLVRAKTLYHKWQTLHEPTAEPMLAHAARLVERTLARTESLAHSPSPPMYSAVFAQLSSNRPQPIPAPYDTGIDGWMRYVRERAAIPVLRYDESTLVVEHRHRGAAKATTANWLLLQKVGKTARDLAIMHLLAGRRDESLELLIGSYRLGQDMNASQNALLDVLIGMATRQIAGHGLAIHGLNACETNQELAEFIRQVDGLAATPLQATADEVARLEGCPLLKFMELRGRSSLFGIDPKSPQTPTRHRAADATLANLRAAVRARLHLLTNGSLPASTKELATLFPESPPIDPFSPGALPLSCRATSAGCVVYSIGPDTTDQKGRVKYDPTNGTISAGDISLDVPRRREYPFPRNGLHAANARQVLETFPNGLPKRSFRPNTTPVGRPQYGNRFAILDSTDTTPVVIFSIGPDGTSPPFVNPALWGFPIPPNQPVHRRAFSEPAPKGSYCLQPSYDPTNGTTSAGDIFITIPPPE